MGSSKLISNREVFHLVLLLQQGGVFWLLPYLILKDNGTAGMVSLLPGLLTGAVIILVCTFWGKRCQEQSFFHSLTAMLGKPLGKLTGFCFLLFYIVFAVSCLYSFVEVINGHLLLETPRLVIAVTIFLAVGWLSWNGLEDLARIVVLCALLLVALVLLALAGSWQTFSLENMLPLSINAPQQLRQAMQYSVFSYGGLLTLFMVYPAVRRTGRIAGQLLLAMVLSSGIFVLWLVLALGMFGQYGVGAMVWLPLELARMIQISSFLERTEALFAVLWMAVVFANGSLLVWSVSEGAHQLLGRKKNLWLHWGAVLLLFLICTQIKNLLQLLQLAQIFSWLSLGFIPALLLLVLAGTWLFGRREDGQHETVDAV